EGRANENQDVLKDHKRRGRSLFKLQTSNFRLQTSDFRLQTSNFELRTQRVPGAAAAAAAVAAPRAPNSRSKSSSDPASSPTRRNRATISRAVFSSSTCSVRNHCSSVISANALVRN